MIIWWYSCKCFYALCKYQSDLRHRPNHDYACDFRSSLLFLFDLDVQFGLLLLLRFHLYFQMICLWTLKLNVTNRKHHEKCSRAANGEAKRKRHTNHTRSLIHTENDTENEITITGWVILQQLLIEANASKLCGVRTAASATYAIFLWVEHKSINGNCYTGNRFASFLPSAITQSVPLLHTFFRFFSHTVSLISATYFVHVKFIVYFSIALLGRFSLNVNNFHFVWWDAALNALNTFKTNCQLFYFCVFNENGEKNPATTMKNGTFDR